MDRNIDKDGSTGITNLSNGGLGFPSFADLSTKRYFKENTESYSVFGQVTWNITDALRINAGVRYTDETKEVDHTYQGEFLVDIPPLNQLVLDEFGIEFFTTEDLPVTEVSDTSTDPSVSVQWDASDGVMLYASYTEATKAGGFNSSSQAPDEFTSFDPETAVGYEFGLKGNFFESRLIANLAIYSTSFDDLQVSALDSATNSFFFKNAAEATTEGIEADLRYAVSDSFEIGGAVGYIDATYDDFPGASCSPGLSQELDCVDNSRNAKGDKLRFAPEWSGNLYADYRFDMNNGMALDLRGDLVYSDDYFWGGQNDPYQTQDAFTKLDLSASLTSADGNWKVSLIGKNMTDETTVSFGGGIALNDGAYWSNVDAPRQIFLSAEYRWY
jgi:iron complex outermembrane receptor protein